MEASVVVLDCLPLFLGHFEGVRPIDPEAFGLGELFLYLEQSLSFIIPVDEHAGK